MPALSFSQIHIDLPQVDLSFDFDVDLGIVRDAIRTLSTIDEIHGSRRAWTHPCRDGHHCSRKSRSRSSAGSHR
jgi:hypothetical protein